MEFVFFFFFFLVLDFISSTSVLGPTNLPIRWTPGAPCLGVKLQGREANHSPPTSAKVKKTWIYTSNSPYVFMVIAL
jgi:hypothetical protein